MIVLDASVLIAYVEAQDAHHERAEQLLADLVDEDLSASTVTLAEVLVGSVRRRELDHAQGVLDDLRVAEVPLGADSAVRLATLRAETRLKLPDCCVLLATQDVQARLATFDDRLRRAARARHLGIVTVPRASR